MSRSSRLLFAAVGIVMVAFFLALNQRAFEGCFQDDEFNTLTWAPAVGARDYLVGFVTPLFDRDNFRPTGHLFFTIMSRSFGLQYPPWIAPVFALHLLNAGLLFLLIRRLAIEPWQALAGSSIFLLAAAAFDVYWKPMYVFDLLCTTFCLASLLLYANRRTILSFVAFWLAYKSKELAVMLPLVLALWEYWFGERRFRRLIPFFAVSLSFGLQGIILNPNRTRNNDYTFHFTPQALRSTIPFYAHRFLMFRASGLLLFLLALIRDRRVWFGLAGGAFLISTLLFLPGRLFGAYMYLPLVFAVIAIAAAFRRVHPLWMWAAVALWIPFNTLELNRGIGATLAADARIERFVTSIAVWSTAHPEIDTLIYNAAPDPAFHHWGITAAWNLMHGRSGMPALWVGWPAAAAALRERTVAWGIWDGKKLTLEIRSPDPTGRPVVK